MTRRRSAPRGAARRGEWLPLPSTETARTERAGERGRGGGVPARPRAAWVTLGAAAALVAAAGCGDAGSGRRPGVARVARAHTLIVAAAAEPRSLLPPYAVDLIEGEVCDLLYQRLAEPVAGFSTVGDRGYRPSLAASWHWAADSLSVRFTLDSTARWHDGWPVTSRDVQFTFALLRDTSALLPRPLVPDVVDSVSTPDARTAVVWARRRTPTLFHDVTYPVHVLPAHLLDTIPPQALLTHARNRLPVGSGPFRLRTWVPGTQLELEAVGRHASGDVQRVVLRTMPSYEAAVTALLAGDVDIFDYVRPHDVPRVLRTPRLATLRLPGFSYAMLQFNLRARPQARGGSGPDRPRGPRPAHPIFHDARVRRALALSVDRQALTANLLGSAGLASPGPFTRAQATADSSLAGSPFDRTRAERLLDAAGWRRPLGGGLRQRAGRALQFTIEVPASSATRLGAAVILQQMFARVGARATVVPLDHATMVQDLERGDFDATLNALSLDPAPAAVREAWGSAAARTGRGFNYGGYASAETDALLDSAAQARDDWAARAWYGRAYRRIVNDAPAVFLYEPVGLLAYDARWRPVGVRADAWWAALGAWQRR